MTLCGGMASSTSPQERVDKLWRVLRDMFADEFTSAVNDQLSDAFLGKELDKGPLRRCF
jgi:hypothetical protein